MDSTLAGFITGIGFTIGLVFGSMMSDSGWKSSIIERGMGLYCPADGEFAFTGECDK